MVMNFKPVVEKAHQTESQIYEQGQPYINIGQVGPQQRAHPGSEGDEQAAHGGRARFGLVSQYVLMNLLAEFQTVEQGDEARSHQDGDHQSEEHGPRRPERDIAEHVERTEVLTEGHEQVIQHGRPDFR